ncbi:MAG: hypothetical protein IPJ65_18665 [Archangiaceae bacterium]|nr:hypothetical protein [Archangiaceae bacterium]
MRTLIAVTFALTACDRQDTPETQAAKAALTDARGTCVQLFQRQRACTDAFIPALVDLRRELNTPKGIAEASREELIPQALAEWKTDSTDEAIAGQCDRLAPQLSAPQVAEGKRCVSLTACGELVSCVMPLMRAQLSR